MRNGRRGTAGERERPSGCLPGAQLPPRSVAVYCSACHSCAGSLRCRAQFIGGEPGRETSRQQVIRWGPTRSFRRKEKVVFVVPSPPSPGLHVPSTTTPRPVLAAPSPPWTTEWFCSSSSFCLYNIIIIEIIVIYILNFGSISSQGDFAFALLLSQEPSNSQKTLLGYFLGFFLKKMLRGQTISQNFALPRPIFLTS